MIDYAKIIVQNRFLHIPLDDQLMTHLQNYGTIAILPYWDEAQERGYFFSNVYPGTFDIFGNVNRNFHLTARLQQPTAEQIHSVLTIIFQRGQPQITTEILQ